MTLRQKLERVRTAVSEDIVQLRIPQNATEDMVRGAEAVAAAIQKLVDENRALIDRLKHADERIRFLQHRLETITIDRDQWGNRAFALARANGELGTILNNIRRMGEGAVSAINEAQAVSSALSAPEIAVSEGEANGRIENLTA